MSVGGWGVTAEDAVEAVVVVLVTDSGVDYELVVTDLTVYCVAEWCLEIWLVGL